mmetsp:Transcript_13210/g.38305  ORF Transcript_13210/g.38305 Transcript_13210/m.38305 type:complete len:206 (+) Transcript_13210:3-620(+)
MMMMMMMIFWGAVLGPSRVRNVIPERHARHQEIEWVKGNPVPGIERLRLEGPDALGQDAGQAHRDGVHRARRDAPCGHPTRAVNAHDVLDNHAFRGLPGVRHAVFRPQHRQAIRGGQHGRQGRREDQGPAQWPLALAEDEHEPRGKGTDGQKRGHPGKEAHNPVGHRPAQGAVRPPCDANFLDHVQHGRRGDAATEVAWCQKYGP